MLTYRQHSSFDADQAELRALREGESSATVGSYDERLAGEAFELGESEVDASPFRTPHWGVEDCGVTLLVSETLRVIKHRQSLLGDLYPFDIDGSGIIYRASEIKVYEYLLATSEAVSNSRKKYRRLIRHFERVATSLVSAFAGPDAKGSRFGWPSEPYFDEMPTGINLRVAAMKKACNFDTDDWKLTTCKYLDKLKKDAKDAKIDFVVRRPLLDSRPGCLTFLGQCGCGRSDVEEESTKHQQLNDNWLSMFFDRTTVPKPVLVFATCQHVVCPSQIYQKQSTGQSLLFDRIRLVKLANIFPGSLASEIRWMQILTEFVKENPPGSSRVF